MSENAEIENHGKKAVVAGASAITATGLAIYAVEIMAAPEVVAVGGIAATVAAAVGGKETAEYLLDRAKAAQGALESGQHEIVKGFINKTLSMQAIPTSEVIPSLGK